MKGLHGRGELKGAERRGLFWLCSVSCLAGLGGGRWWVLGPELTGSVLRPSPGRLAQGFGRYPAVKGEGGKSDQGRPPVPAHSCHPSQLNACRKPTSRKWRDWPSPLEHLAQGESSA